MRCPNCGTDWEIYLRPAEPFRTLKMVDKRHSQIVRMRAEGLSLAAIGRRLGVTATAIHRHAKGDCKCEGRLSA